FRTRLDRATEPAPTVASAAWDAYMQVFQRLSADDQLATLASWNSSAADRMVLLAAAVKPDIRPAVARKLLDYVTALNKTDSPAAVAFVDQLTKTVPDLFGSEWAPRFNAVRKTPEPTTSHPAASRPGS
ncbi:MAG TPA: hypothetical protein VLM89_14825, partial [Phycisphaerae bacterium]|nr:hypothetical protein [Phycisphaerae bacterium]